MRRGGVITGYTIGLDPAALGYAVGALVFLKIRQHDWRRARDAIAAIPGVESLMMCAGEYDLVATVRCADMAAFRDTLLVQLHAIDDVLGSSTAFVLDETRRALAAVAVRLARSSDRSGAPMGEAHGHDHGRPRLRAGARHHGRLLHRLGADRRLPRRAGGRRDRHRVAGPAVRRRAHGHRRPRPRHGAGGHPRRQPRGRTAQRTFGLYRLEILAALANAVLLFGVAGYVLYRGGRPARRRAARSTLGAGARRRRARAGREPRLVRCCCATGAKESLNVRGAYLEVLSRHPRLGRRDRGRRRDGASPAGRGSTR